MQSSTKKKRNPPAQNDNISKLDEKDVKIVAELVTKIKNIKAIYPSPFYRCMKTAKLINQHIQVPIYKKNSFNKYGSIEKIGFNFKKELLVL